MAWTEQDKALVVEKYLAKEPTAANSMEIVKEIADEMKQSANGVRSVLSQAKVYIKKEEAKATSTSETKGKAEGAKRVSKDDQIAELRAAIEAKGAEIDDEILTKLTGKAAAYFTKVITA